MQRILSSMFAGLTICFLLLAGTASAGQAIAPAGEQDAVSIPRLVNYQGFLTDAGGTALNGSYDMGFRILDAATGGTSYWSETQAGVAVSEGVFNVILGSVSSIESLPDGPGCWLEITVGGELITPRVRLASVPYAYGAELAADAEDAQMLGGIPAASYATQGWVNGQGFATQSWVTGQGYATQTWVAANDAGRSGVAANLYEGTTSLSSKYAGITHAHSAGDITSGTLPIARGGTNNTAYTTGGALYYSGTAITSTGAGTSGQVLTSNGASAPTWQTPAAGVTSVSASAPLNSSGGNNPNISLTGTVPVGNGGTGVASLTANRLLVGGTTVGQITPATGYLYWNGTAYAWQTPASGVASVTASSPLQSSGGANPNITLTGTVSVGNGGTGLGSVANNYLLRGTGGAALAAIAPGTGYLYWNGSSYAWQTPSTGVTGSGTANYGARWTAASTLGNGALQDNGSAVAVGTAPLANYAVYGYNSNATSTFAGVYGYGYYYGVYGYGPNRTGVYGAAANASGYGVAGYNSAGYGVYGYTNSSGYAGVYGYTPSGVGFSYSGVYGSGGATGVIGTGGVGSYQLWGVLGCNVIGNSMSGVYGNGSVFGNSYGVHGYGGGGGVYGASSNNGTYGLLGHSPLSGPGAGAYGYANSSSNHGVYGYNANSSGSAGYFYNGGSGIYMGICRGNAAYSGYLTNGTKYAVVRTSDYGFRALACVESPEVWFEDFGEARLVNGRCHVELEPVFLQTVAVSDAHPMKVFVQQTSGEEPVSFVVRRGTKGFDVIGPAGSDVAFTYRVVAKRAGFQDQRLADLTGVLTDEEKSARPDFENR